MLHRYANVPAVVSLTALLAPLGRSPVSNDPSDAVNVCVTPSVFLTGMLVPLVRVRVRGANVKFSITIVSAAGCARAAAAEVLGRAITRVSASATIATIGMASATRAIAGFLGMVTVEVPMLVLSSADRIGHASEMTLPLSVATYTTPFDTVGEDCWIAEPAANGGLTFAPEVASTSRTTPSRAAV